MQLLKTMYYFFIIITTCVLAQEPVKVDNWPFKTRNEGGAYKNIPAMNLSRSLLR